ncbi:MAG: hypothetical protein ACI4AA_06220 [Lachnospiraceae bacterium]
MERVWKTGEKMIKAVAMGIMALLFVVLFWLFLQGFTFYEAADFLYSFAKVPELALLCGLAVLFFVILYVASGKWFSLCGAGTLRVIKAMVILGMLTVQCYFLFYVRSYYKWDSGFVIGGAASLAETGSVAEEALYYLSVYPNQNTFVLITSALVRLGNLFGIGSGERPLLFNVFNTICLDLSLFLTLRIIKKWKKELRDWEICRILLMFACNPFLYLGVSYYYTITLSLPLTMGFLYLLLCLWNAKGEEKDNKKNGYLKAVMAGVLLGAGYELRATAVILGIAALVTGVWKLFAQKKSRREPEERKQQGRMAVQLAVVMFSALIFASGLSTVQKAYIGIDTTDTAFPTTHWLMMSLTLPGSHNGEDEAYTASFGTKEEKEAAVAARLWEKLEDMSVSDYVRLVKTKIRNTFGTGMNGYPVFLADALRTDGVYEAVFGGHKDFVILWHQGYYLFLLLGILIYMVRWGYDCVQQKETDFYGFTLLLILFGAVLFYALWEASEQYSVPFMMIMEMLCFAGLTVSQKAQDENDDWEEKIRKKAQKAASRCAFAATAVIAVWGIARYKQVTEVNVEQSHPVAVQILANTSYPVDDGQKLVQTLKLTQPFNRLIIQWRNPAQETSTAIYRLRLREKSGKVVFEAEIDAAGTGYNGAGIYDFETVVPEQHDYELQVEKISGIPSDDLEFVIYDMYGYTPYSAGELSLCQSDEKQIMEASMLFSVSEETIKSYTTGTKYVIFISVLFLIFLFAGFWCKLRVVSFDGEER